MTETFGVCVQIYDGTDKCGRQFSEWKGNGSVTIFKTVKQKIWFLSSNTYIPVYNFLMRKKFLYLFQCEEYDTVEIIVRGVNEMYN